jgi:hypothetical protein
VFSCVPEGQARTEIWVRFIWFLRARYRVNPRAVGSFLAAVKRELGLRRVALDFADDGLVMIRNARRAAQRQTRAELRETLRQREERLKLPFFDVLADWLYMEFWVDTGWDWEGKLLKMICVALYPMEFFGFRPVNMVRPRRNGEDHALRAGDFSVVYRDTSGRMCSAVGGSEELKKYTYRDVVEIHVLVLSTKWSVMPVRKLVTQADQRGQRVIRVLMGWFVHSGVRPEELLCTCHRVSNVNGRPYSYTLTSAKLNKAIKTAAEANGFPAQHFSCRSLRSGMATRGGLTGEDEATTAERGGWRSHRVMQHHYNFAQRLHRAPGDTAPLRAAEVISLMAPHLRAPRATLPVGNDLGGEALPARRAGLR